MRKIGVYLALACFFLGGAGLAVAAQASKPAAKPDLAKVLGFWELEVSADGQIINLTMTLDVVEGKLTGKVSEPNGMFADAPLTDLAYDGETLKGTLTVPSPPDMATRPWAVEVKVGADTFEGTVGNAELQITAALTGERTKK